jgi:hypothetical protein
VTTLRYDALDLLLRRGVQRETVDVTQSVTDADAADGSPGVCPSHRRPSLTPEMQKPPVIPRVFAFACDGQPDLQSVPLVHLGTRP